MTSEQILELADCYDKAADKLESATDMISESSMPDVAQDLLLKVRRGIRERRVLIEDTRALAAAIRKNLRLAAECDEQWQEISEAMLTPEL